MLCEHCGKNPATHHFTQNWNGNEKSLHLCSGCAEQQGPFFESGDPISSLGSLFANLAGQGVSATFPNAPASSEITCPVCGETAAGIAQSGQVGCARCYQTFAGLLAPYLSKLYGKAAHTGRRPLSAGAVQPSPGEEMDRLLRLQAEAIRKERFEEAAALRDEINRLKPENGGDTV